VSININDEEYCNENSNDECNGSFMNWALSIANNYELEVETIEGEYDNAQNILELIPLIVKTIKLYPFWSGIMRKSIGYGHSSK
jgi:hypothetical protein